MADDTRSVGFIGVGTMGFPMASNLLEKGFSVTAFDVSEAALERIVAAGARPAASPAAVGAACRYVVSMLPSPPHVEDALIGPSGIAEGMAAGGTVIDMSTIDPDTTRRVARRLAERGLRMIDAPVSGAPPKARDGTLTIMVGGEAAVVEECRPILETLGSHVIHVGPLGAGETVKLVNNLIAAITMAAVAEAFNIGLRNGIDAQVLYDVISKSSGDCWTLRTRVPYPGVVDGSPANEDFAPGFMVDLMHKDLGLALAAARAVDAPALLGGATEQLYRAARAQGYGRKDFSAIVKVVQSLAGG